MGALLVATVTGLLSIVVFQKIANYYLASDRAFVATFVYFLFPPVFVFSGVSYSEPVFLLFSLLCWYYYLRGSNWKSSIAAGMSSLARSYGVLIVVPLALGYLKRGQYRKLAYCITPLFTLSGWLIYSILQTGSVAPLYGQGTFLTRTPEYYVRLEETIRESLEGNAGLAMSRQLEYVYGHLAIIVVSLISIALAIVLAIRTVRIDRALGMYTILSTGAILYFSLAASFNSFPRLSAFIFPIGLTLNTKKMSLFLFSLIIFALLDYLAWYAFLTDGFY
jgi:hypothetical protein